MCLAIMHESHQMDFFLLFHQQTKKDEFESREECAWEERVLYSAGGKEAAVVVP